ENSALDLWSICNFLIPGILPEPDKLQKFLETEQGLILIRKMLSSFILRRKKTEVLKELPEKTEISVRCVMEDAQRKLYDEILNQARDEAKTYFDKRTNY